MNILPPPHSEEAEQAVLGGLMILGKNIDSILLKLESDDFYISDNKVIFEAISKAYKNDLPIDAVGISEAMDRENLTISSGQNLVYLAQLSNNIPSASNIDSYADIVKERAMKRKLLLINMKIGEMAYHSPGSFEEIRQESMALFETLIDSEESSFSDMSDCIDEFAEEFKRRGEVQGMDGLSTGLAALDSIFHGLKPGLIVLGARPSMGKTTLALNIAHDVALSGEVALVFSMEMPRIQLMDKLTASKASVPLTSIKSGKVTEDEKKEIRKVLSDLKQSNLFIDDNPHQTVKSIKMKCHQKRIKHGKVGLVVVDYLQLMDGQGKSRLEQIGEISRGLKVLSGELQCPVVVLSQLNRGLESRPDKRPLLSDLRESGSIEQDADIVAFIYRDSVYHPEAPANSGYAEINVSKFRNGEPGKAVVECELSHSRFKNALPGYQPHINYKKQSEDFDG